MDIARDSEQRRNRKSSYADLHPEAADERSPSPKNDGKELLQDFFSNLNRVRGPERESESNLESEVQNRRAELTKLRYRKLRQRLASLCYKHEEISLGKEATSSNKPRIMRLALDLERQFNNQVRDYGQIEGAVRELVRLLEQKKENDLHIVRQSRLLPSLMEFFKKVPPSHKNQYRESAKILEPASRILSLFCSISINREYMILTNRVQVIASLLNWALSKKEELQDTRLPLALLNLLTCLLDHRLESDSGSILQESIQLILYSQLMRRLRQQIQSSFADDSLVEEPLLRSILKFYTVLLGRIDPRQFRPQQQLLHIY